MRVLTLTVELDSSVMAADQETLEARLREAFAPTSAAGAPRVPFTLVVKRPESVDHLCELKLESPSDLPV